MAKRVEIQMDFKDNSSNKMDSVIKKLNTMQTTISKISGTPVDIMGGNNTVVVNQVLDSVQKLNDKSKDLNKEWKSLFNVAKMTAFVAGAKRLFSVMTKLTKESANFVENVNLTEVAFYGNTKAVKDLYTTMSDVYNLDESKIVRRVGIFKQMANAMGLAEEQGESLSILLNKMTLDVSSLYNIDIERASNALQSSLVGQTRPIRGATGADITEKTLERTLGRIVPDRYIRDLSFLEKRLVMIISLNEQLKTSQGDWARTLESPSNQLKILNEQTTRFSRALGNLLMPILGKILPYLNAFMMVITAIVNSLARLVGFKMPEFDYSGLQGMSDSALDLEEQLNGASASAEKLRNGLRGFDKLNVITTPSSGAGAGVGSGIDPRILEEFDRVAREYNDMMGEVQTKASKIADKVLRWLGFEKDINGEYKFRKITLGTILASVGGILAAVKTLGAFKNVFSNIFSIFTGGKVATSVAETTKHTGLLAKLLGGLTVPVAIAVAAIAAVIGVLIHAYNTNEDFRKSVQETFDKIGEYFTKITETIGNALKEIWAIIEPTFILIKNIVVTVFETFYDTVVSSTEGVMIILRGVADFLIKIFEGDIGGAFSSLGTMINDLWGNFQEFAGKLYDRFIQLGKDIYQWAKDGVAKMIEKMGEFLQWIIELPGKLGYWMGQAVGTLIRIVKETNWIQLGKDIIKWIFDGLSNINEKVTEWKNTLWSKIKEKITTTDWTQLGKDILNGIIKGMSNIGSALKNWSSGFLRGIKDALGISSPSALMINAKVGDFTTEGILVGMNKELDELDGFAKNLVNKIDDATRNEVKKVSLEYSSFAPNNIPQLLSNPLNSQSSNSSNKQPAIFNIQVGDTQIAKIVLDNLNEMASSNGKPITIGG